MEESQRVVSPEDVPDFPWRGEHRHDCWRGGF